MKGSHFDQYTYSRWQSN